VWGGRAVSEERITVHDEEVFLVVSVRETVERESPSKPVCPEEKES